MRPFFDTNVLVYAFDEGEPEKREIALGLIKEHLEEGDGILSMQVLREFYAAVRRLSRPLSAAEAEGIRPNRVDIYVVRDGDTWASIAERSGGLVRPATLAIMNNVAPDTAPRPGARIKIVVSG